MLSKLKKQNISLLIAILVSIGCAGSSSNSYKENSLFDVNSTKNSDLEILDSLHKMSFFRESSSARKAMELCGDLLKLRGSSLSLEPSLMLNIADKLEESKIEINHSLKDMKDEDKKSKLSELRLNIIRKTRTNL